MGSKQLKPSRWPWSWRQHKEMASKVALLALLSTTVSANEEFCPKLCRDCDELGNCLTCKGYNLLQLYDCVESCSVGFFPSGDECHECPWECDSCTSLTECQSCRVDYFHQASSCVDECSEGYFLSDNTCEQCSSDCIECYEFQECFRCKSGTLLQNNKCVLSCSDGYSEVSSDLCLPCHTGCATCIGPNQQESPSLYFSLFICQVQIEKEMTTPGRSYQYNDRVINTRV